MKVLIVDDHAVVRRGLESIVRDSLPVEMCVTADGPDTAIELATTVSPDLVLLDLRLPGVHQAASLCAKLRSVVPSARIVIVTAFADLGEIKACLAAGAQGCLLKDTTELDIAAALREIDAGVMMIDPRISRRLADEFVGVLRRGEVVRLTNREREILALLAEGCSNVTIALRLSLAQSTVKGHVSSIMEKLDATSRLHAVVVAVESGLLS